MNLQGVPTAYGLQILRQELFDHIKRFQLIDEYGNVYYTHDVHSVYVDSSGTLTVTFLIPIDEHLTRYNKYIALTEQDGTEIARYETPAIQFVAGVGGEQIAKLPISGEPGTVYFKADDYLTESEAEELYLAPVVNGLAQSVCVSNQQIKQEIKQI